MVQSCVKTFPKSVADVEARRRQVSPELSTRRLAVLAAVLVLGSACASSTTRATGAVVIIRAEPGILADAASIVIRVYGSDGRSANGGDVLREQRTVQLGASLGLPYTIGVTPLEGDTTRLYRIEVEARDANGGLIATAKVVSGYVRGRVLEVDLRFDDACRGITCADAGLTCKAAVCVDAHVDPTTTPDYVPDGGARADASIPVDASTPVDSSVLTCDPGYVVSGTACTDIDECATSNGGCHPLTTCINEPGAFSCSSCPTGYTGDGPTGCVDIDECATSNGGCDPNATCLNQPGSATCGACASGFSGDNASGCVDIDECATVVGACDALTTCTNDPGSYACSACPVGYTGTGQIGCTDVNECATNSGGCGTNATCTNTAGSSTCACNPGYAGDGLTCSDIDDCAGMPCQHGGLCADEVNAYACTCANGWSGADCTQNIDDCAGATCQNGGTCVDGVGTYTCTCPSGYTGTNCQTIVVGCATSPCVNGTCTDTGPGTYSCVCAGGWQGINCDTPVDACTPTNPCANGGVCSFTGPGTYTCQCAAGWTGATCSVDINECLTANGGCSTSPMVTCTNTPGGRTCAACPVNYVGDGITCVLVNCGAAPSVANATRVISGGVGGGTTTTVGATAAYTCSTGYAKSGSNITCQASGLWTSPAPTCTAIASFCPTPAAITNDVASSPTVSGGVAGGTTNSYGATATYTCRTGYSRTGGNATCGATGTWSAAPSCTAVSAYCPALTAPVNGAVAVSGGVAGGATTSYNATATYACTAGYSLSSSATRICESGGSWSGSAPTCADVNECLTANGGCDTSPMTTCTNTTGAFSCAACPAGYFGTSLTGCISGTNTCGYPTYPMPGTPGHPFSYKASASTVVDLVTGLEWQRAMPATSYSQASAITYCASLSLGGRTDWRLPSRTELVTLVHYDLNPAYDALAFPSTAADLYWTSNVSGSSGQLVDFNTGWVDAVRASGDQHYVRCVR